jgi:hypothetical protein
MKAAVADRESEIAARDKTIQKEESDFKNAQTHGVELEKTLHQVKDDDVKAEAKLRTDLEASYN